jgi:POT family proton-dependent oligopeptide transporter
MGIAQSKDDVIPASTYQSINPIFIMIFGLVFTALWAFLSNKGWEPNTPVKFALGLMQLGLGFGALWYGALMADERGMVAMAWLLLGYLLHTTGELCLSPVGLSMITRLAPTRLVSTMMGCWFLSSSAANLLAAVIAQFTGVESGGGNGDSIPIPSETVLVYGSVFKAIAISALISGVICLLISPLLKFWMHEGEEV